RERQRPVAMGAHLARDREAETAAVRLALPRFVAAEGALPQARQLRRKDAGAVVDHREGEAIVLRLEDDGDVTARVAVGDGVLDQVRDHLLRGRGMTAREHRGVRAGDVELDGSTLREVTDAQRNALDDLAEIHGGVARSGVPAVAQLTGEA